MLKTLRKIKKMFPTKKGIGRSLDVLLDKLLIVIVIPIAAAALVPTILASFVNLSTSGLILSALFGTVLGILLAVFLFKTISGSLR